MPGVFRSGNSYGDSATAAVAGAQPRGLPSAQNMAAADALAQRSEQESVARIASGQTARGFAVAPAQPQAGWSGVIGSDPAAGRERKEMIDRLTTPHKGSPNGQLTLGQLNALNNLYDREARTAQAEANNATSLQQTQMQGDASRDVSVLREAGETRRSSLQQALADIRDRRTAQHQSSQNDIARQRLALDVQKAGQGSIPAGYRARQDGSGLEFIPGGPADPRNSKESVQQNKDTQDVFSILDQARPLLKTATGSYAGALTDKVAQVGGWSPKGADSAAQLKALQGALVSKMPKMSGPQSDKDVQLYQEMAGRIGDPNVPAEQRMAAMKTVEDLNMKYLPVATDAGAYQALPAGSYFKTPDGSVRRKQ